MPPADAQWVPPQRTFAPLGANRFDTERVRQVELGAAREFSAMTVSVRAFRQAVENQLVTVFGAADPARLIAAGGHYGLASAGDASLRGWAVGVAHEVAPHVRGRVDYTFVSAEWTPSTGADRRALRTFAPQALRQPSEQVHDVSASLDAEVPQTATRFVLLYKVNSGFVDNPAGLQTANGRFDMELRQGLPFMGGMGDWEMLLGVRSLFRAVARRPLHLRRAARRARSEAAHRRPAGPVLIPAASGGRRSRAFRILEPASKPLDPACARLQRQVA